MVASLVGVNAEIIEHGINCFWQIQILNGFRCLVNYSANLVFASKWAQLDCRKFISSTAWRLQVRNIGAIDLYGRGYVFAPHNIRRMT